MWSPVEVVRSEGGGGGGGEVPCARAKHAAALLGACVYVLGGRGAGGAVPLRDCWRYHLASGHWERVRARGDVPPALQEHSATPHAQRLYVFGGETSLSAETPLWILDTESLIWRKLPGSGAGATGATGGGGAARRRGRSARPAAPGARRGHSAHALNDCLLIYGGYKDLRGSTNELWAFHYESESWQQVRTAGAGPARHRHAAALHDARLYVHGGQCDLRACADLWHYDTLSRAWAAVRCAPRLAPPARCGHAGLRAGAHFYIFGGELDGSPCNELWRFHFATEMWERMATHLQWPAARVDACALAVSAAAAGAGGAGAARGRSAPPARPRPDPAPPAGLLRELSKLSAFHLRRAARCSYSVLDSSESVRDAALAKSRSAHHFEPPGPPDSPREGDVPESFDLSRGPVSVPDFADMVPPRPLLFLDSDEEERGGRGGRCRALPKSASVRFSRDAAAFAAEEESSTSDYASGERVNRAGFSNPHYLGPDVRALAALTPDSGVAPLELELTELRPPAPPPPPALLLLGGREPPHPAHLQGPLTMWTYTLL